MYDTELEYDEAELDEMDEYGYEVDELESPFSEEEEADLAAELLEVSDEAELDQFLGSLIKRAGSAVRGIVRSPIGRAVGGVLRGAARKALPWAGRAVGTYFGGPVGGAIGGKLAGAAGRALGLELEGLPPDVQEFEIAKKFVRFAGSTAQKALASGSAASPVKAALAAAASAARRHAPGLVRPLISKAQQLGVAGGRLTRPGGRLGKRCGRCRRCGCRVIVKPCGCR